MMIIIIIVVVVVVCLFFFPAFQPSETEIFSDLKWKMRLYTLIVLDL